MKTKYSKIYIHTPCNYVTGGVELLHQLADFLLNNGEDAYIVYFGNGSHAIHAEYRKYNVKCVEEDQIENSENCLEIYTELMGKALLTNARDTQKFMWWMSVDNFYKVGYDKICLKDLYLFGKKIWIKNLKYRINLSLVYRRNEFKHKIGIQEFNKKKVLYGYQCEYIHQHLIKAGVKGAVPLSDYINTDYLEVYEATREDIVLYNPSKGFEFTRRLIAAAPGIRWVPIAGYDRKSLSELINRSKIYIDFGNHPGKDRLPRECAIKGCCIITGKRGSAAYQSDIDIPSKYKFDEKRNSVEEIIRAIKSTLLCYYECKKDFESYRLKIFKEKEIFENEVRELFGIDVI